MTTNREGLTFYEWFHAASLADPDGIDHAYNERYMALRDAWWRGEDPTEWRAFPVWPGEEYDTRVTVEVWLRLDTLWFWVIEVPIYMPHSGAYIASSRRAAIDHQVPVGVPRG